MKANENGTENSVNFKKIAIIAGSAVIAIGSAIAVVLFNKKKTA
jgi:hypothetical protein